MDGNQPDKASLDRRSYLSSSAATVGILSFGVGNVSAGEVETKTDQEGSKLNATQTNPARKIAIQPGTSVLFEIESDAVGEYSSRTQWFVDGEPKGRSLGPWYRAYYSHQGAECWYQTFESEGTYEVAAVIDGDNKDSRATWMVHVSPDGTVAPSIEKTQPADESLEVGRDEETDLELTVADPNGDLDRVVWWLGHADDILDVTDVSGSEDTASLSFERVCDRCPIIAWVIGEDGSITQERLWMINEVTE